MSHTNRIELTERAEAYLRELEVMLHNTSEADEVAYEIRSYIEHAVKTAAPGREEEAVNIALDELGTVEQIASTATVTPTSEPGGAGLGKASGIVYALRYALAVIAVPVAALAPLFGPAFALAIFIWSLLSDRTQRSAYLTPLVIAGVAVAVGVLMFTLQMPTGPSPVSVEIPGTPS